MKIFKKTRINYICLLTASQFISYLLRNSFLFKFLLRKNKNRYFFLRAFAFFVHLRRENMYVNAFFTLYLAFTIPISLAILFLLNNIFFGSKQDDGFLLAMMKLIYVSVTVFLSSPSFSLQLHCKYSVVLNFEESSSHRYCFLVVL